MVETRQKHANGSVITENGCSLRKVLRVVPAQRHVSFDEARVLMHLERDEHVDEVLPSDKVKEDLLAGGPNAEDNWDLRITLPSNLIIARSSSSDDFSTILEKVHCSA